MIDYDKWIPKVFFETRISKEIFLVSDNCKQKPLIILLDSSYINNYITRYL